jgi:hypothetical protein
MTEPTAKEVTEALKFAESHSSIEETDDRIEGILARALRQREARIKELEAELEGARKVLSEIHTSPCVQRRIFRAAKNKHVNMDCRICAKIDALSPTPKEPKP